VVIPAHDEAGCIETTLTALVETLEANGIDHEIVVVNDHSTDGTAGTLERIKARVARVRSVENLQDAGFGWAVRTGIAAARGDAIAIYMADASDRPEDLVRFYRTMVDQQVHCVFGTRFARESKVEDYPWPKLVLNRLGNKFIQIIFGLRYNDVTNAFKLYSREALEGVRPYLSHHFNLTVELPLKAIVRGYSYTVIPNDWIHRKAGVSKLRIKEMGSRYMFIVLYCLLEKWLSRGDYRKRDVGRAL
jgi:dolichol-phosphate mannosyltransferase